MSRICRNTKTNRELLMEDTIDKILKSMSKIKKHHRIFITILLCTLMFFRGKATFRNMSRYCGINEKRFSRWYRREFDFTVFNCKLLAYESKEKEYIAAIDASFMEKSGKKTEGLGKFYNGKTGRSEYGLEMSLVSIIDMTANTAYALDARQTLNDTDKTKTDCYVQQVKRLKAPLNDLDIKYLVCDAYYTKEKFIRPVTEQGLHIVGKLRIDADAWWPYQGEYKGKGRPKRYDGKVNFSKDTKRFEYVGKMDQEIEVYTTIVWLKMIKQKIRIVLLKFKDKHVLLYSTDTALGANKIISYYKARYQIEFVFRDAKQHTGLTHCQSRSKKAIHTQINASLTALNLIKLQDKWKKNTDKKTVISIASWKRRKLNQHLMKTLFQELDLDMKDQKVMDVYKQFSNYGTIAA